MGKYANVTELPPQVTDMLSEAQQKNFLEHYNTAPDGVDAYEYAWKCTLNAITSLDSPTIALAVPDNPKLERCIQSVFNSEDMKKKYPNAQERKSHAIAVCRSQLNLSEWTVLHDIRGLEFDDSDATWIQALPVGKYLHPVYGEIDITPERVERFVSNIKGNVRGQQLDIDYEHKQNPTEGGRAAGWVLDAESRGAQGGWVKVQWTPRAKQALRDGEYRYFSPEIADSWKHPQTGTTHNDVMFGGAITNRPFLKGILPINLSEMFGSVTFADGREEGMDELLKKLAKLLKLDEANADEAKVLAEVTKLSERTSKVEPDPVRKPLTEALGLEEDAKDEAILSEIKKLAEEKKETIKAKKFAEDYPEEAKRLKALQEQGLKDAATKKLQEWTKHEKSQLGIPPSIHDSVVEFRMGLSEDDAEKFDAILDETVKNGLVDFSERGSERRNVEDDDSDTEKKFDEKVQEVMKEKKLSYTDAARVVADEHPELATIGGER